MKKLLFFAVCTMCFAACTKEASNVNQSPEVKVVSPDIYSSGRQNEFDFISAPYRTSELSFRIGGPLQKLDVQSGQFFRKGTVIASVDNRDYKIAQQRSKAELAQKKAEFHRIENLYKKDNISASTYEKAKADCEKAEADYREASNKLQDTRLIAPFDGYVQQVFADNFDEVSPGQPVLTFIDLSQIKMAVSIPEKTAHILRTAPQDICRAVFSSNIKDTLSADQIFISQSTSATNISYTCTAILRNKNQEFMGGMSGRLIFDIPDDGSNTLAVPLEAVCHDPVKGAYLWGVNKNNQAYRIWVSTGSINAANQVEILHGLHAADKIICNNIHNLSDNKKVIIQ